MTTALDLSWELPYTPAALFEQGIRREYVEEMSRVLGQRRFQLLELADGPEGGHAVARYLLGIELPSWAAKFVPPTAKMTERREWGPAAADGSRSYTVSIKLDTVPVVIDGTVGLITAGDGTLNTVHFDITAKMAILGKKLEEMTAADVTRNAELQRDFALNWMKTH